MEESFLLRVLQGSFSEEEWEYLRENRAFQAQVKGREESVETVTCLIESGLLLLRQRGELMPQ